VRVERRVVPVSADPERRLAVLERELWRIAVENLNYSEQHAWAALAGARVTPNNWRRAKAMLQHHPPKELRRRFRLTCVQRNRNHQLRLKALGEIAALREAEPFDDAVEVVGAWPRDERRAGAKVLLQALAERRIGRRDQAQAWVWRLAGTTRDLHEQYAVQRWPETKRLLGLFVNSSGRAHGRNARRLVHAVRHRGLPVRRRPRRADRARDRGRLLPLHPLPAAHGNGFLDPGPHRRQDLPAPPGRGAREGVAPFRRRIREVLLRRMRRAPV